MTDDEDIYSDLTSINYFEAAPSKKFEEENVNLKELLEERERELSEIKEKNVALEKEKKTLEENISSLYKTAVNELKKKEAVIDELTRQKDSILFRRERKQFRDLRPTNVSVETKNTYGNSKYEDTNVSDRKNVSEIVNDVIQDQESVQTHEEKKSTFNTGSNIDAIKRANKCDTNDRLSQSSFGSKYCRDLRGNYSKSSLTEGKSDARSRSSESNSDERHSRFVPHMKKGVSGSNGSNRHRSSYSKYRSPRSNGDAVRKEEKLNDYSTHRYSHRDDRRRPRYSEQYHRERHHTYTEKSPSPKRFKRNSDIPRKEHSDLKYSGSSEKYKVKQSDSVRLAAQVKSKYSKADRERSISRSVSRTPVKKNKDTKSSNSDAIDTRKSKNIPNLHLSQLKVDSHLVYDKTKGDEKPKTNTSNDSLDSNNYLFHPAPLLESIQGKLNKVTDSEKVKSIAKSILGDSSTTKDNSSKCKSYTSVQNPPKESCDGNFQPEELKSHSSEDIDFRKFQDGETEHESFTLPTISPFKLQKDSCVFEQGHTTEVPENHEICVQGKIVRKSSSSITQLTNCETKSNNYSPPPSPHCSLQNSCASRAIDSKESSINSKKSHKLVKTISSTPSSTQSESSENEGSTSSCLSKKDLCVSKIKVTKTSVRSSDQTHGNKSKNIVSAKCKLIIDQKESESTSSPLADPLQFQKDPKIQKVSCVSKIMDGEDSSRTSEKPYQTGSVVHSVPPECQNVNISEETDNRYIKNVLPLGEIVKSLEVEMKTESVNKSLLQQVLPQEVISYDVPDEGGLITAPQKSPISGTISNMNVKLAQNVDSKALCKCPNVTESVKTDAVAKKSKTFKVSRTRSASKTKSPSSSTVDTIPNASSSNLLKKRKLNKNNSYDILARETTSASFIHQESQIKRSERLVKSSNAAGIVETVQKQIKLFPKEVEAKKICENSECPPQPSILYNLLNKSSLNSTNHTEPSSTLQDSTIITTPIHKSSSLIQTSPSLQDCATVKEHKFSYSVSNEQCEFQRPKRKRSVRLSGGQGSQSNSPVTENDNEKNMQKLRSDIEIMSKSIPNFSIYPNTTVCNVTSKNSLNDTRRFFKKSQAGNDRNFAEVGGEPLQTQYQVNERHITSSSDEVYAQTQSENKNNNISSHTSEAHSLFSLSQKTCQDSKVNDIHEKNVTNKTNDMGLLNTSKKITKEKSRRKNTTSNTPKKITKTCMNVGDVAFKNTSANVFARSDNSDLPFILSKAKQNLMFDSIKNKQSTGFKAACSVENNLLSISRINNKDSGLNMKSLMDSKSLGHKMLMKSSPNKKKNLDTICDELKANLEKKNNQLTLSSSKMVVDSESVTIVKETVCSSRNTSERIIDEKNLLKESSTEKSNADVDISVICNVNVTETITSEKVLQKPLATARIVSKVRRRLGNFEDSPTPIHTDVEIINKKSVPTPKNISSTTICEKKFLKQSFDEKICENSIKSVPCDVNSRTDKSEKLLQKPSTAPRVVVSKFQKRVGNLEDSPTPVHTDNEIMNKKSVSTRKNISRTIICEKKSLKQSFDEKICENSNKSVPCDVNSRTDKSEKLLQKPTAPRIVVSKFQRRVGNLEDSPTTVCSEIEISGTKSVQACTNISSKTICEKNLKLSSAEKIDQDTNESVICDSDNNRTDESKKILQKPSTAPRIVVSKFRRRVGNLEDSPTTVCSEIEIIGTNSVQTCTNISSKTICEKNLKLSSAEKIDQDTNERVICDSDDNRTEESKKILQKPSTAPRIIVSKFRRRVGNLEDSPTHVFSKIKSNPNQL